MEGTGELSSANSSRGAINAPLANRNLRREIMGLVIDRSALPHKQMRRSSHSTAAFLRLEAIGLRFDHFTAAQTAGADAHALVALRRFGVHGT